MKSHDITKQSPLAAELEGDGLGKTKESLRVHIEKMEIYVNKLYECLAAKRGKSGAKTSHILDLLSEFRIIQVKLDGIVTSANPTSPSRSPLKDVSQVSEKVEELKSRRERRKSIEAVSMATDDELHRRLSIGVVEKAAEVAERRNNIRLSISASTMELNRRLSAGPDDITKMKEAAKNEVKIVKEAIDLVSPKGSKATSHVSTFEPTPAELMNLLRERKLSTSSLKLRGKQVGGKKSKSETVMSTPSSHLNNNQSKERKPSSTIASSLVSGSGSGEATGGPPPSYFLNLPTGSDNVGGNRKMARREERERKKSTTTK